MKTVIIGLLMIGLLAGGATYYLKYATAEPPGQFKTAPIKRGEILVTVGATGTIEPEEVVDVGAQVTGPILELGPDPRGDTDPAYKGKRVDYTTPVEKGTVLVKIDPAVYKANYDQAQATLDRSQADLGELIAKRDQADAEWKRAQVLHDIKLPALSATDIKRGLAAGEPMKAISDSDYDLTKSNYDVAKANVDVGQATIVQAEAALNLAKANLGYCTIQSPVKGTIVSRRVNIGQTVVANLSAASLFLIAEDLSRMQVWAQVNEADIGRIKVGMPVQFSVAAMPEETFTGQVYQIRLDANSTQNVVVYTVVITFDNSGMKVLPYLTADPVKFITEKHDDVLTVPIAALAFQPRPEDIAPSEREDSEASPGGGSVAASEGSPPVVPTPPAAGTALSSGNPQEAATKAAESNQGKKLAAADDGKSAAKNDENNG
ncbi:MAG TPA: efflux RND transporter periplasmic adaptor subunit, partial [Pirellulales bacterium]